MMNSTMITLDVREEIWAGREPLSLVLETVSRLKDGENLRLIVPFEPMPLYELMARRGFLHESHLTVPGDWEVLFTRDREDSVIPRKTPATSPSAPDCAPVAEVDARGLEPPQPLVVILEALAGLREGATMRARTDRRPLHLYAQLEERGFTGETEQQHDGSFITTIRQA